LRGSYTNWDLIADVFKKEKRPLGVKEIWDVAVEMKLDKKTENKGKTPWNNLHSMFNYRKKIGNDEYIQVEKKWMPKTLASKFNN
jgi:hypothetical protein